MKNVPIIPADAPKTGEVFRHYKGDNYKVLDVALHSDDTWHVVYEPVYEGAVAKLFSRPVAEWREVVEWQGQKVERFVKMKKEFSFDTEKSNFAEITLNFRYPAQGYSLNTESEMTVYVLDGKVTLQQDGDSMILQKGESVLVKVNKKYFWEPLPKVSLLIFSTPPWTSEQAQNVK